MKNIIVDMQEFGSYSRIVLSGQGCIEIKDYLNSKGFGWEGCFYRYIKKFNPKDIKEVEEIKDIWSYLWSKNNVISSGFKKSFNLAYKTWMGIFQRCENFRNTSYNDYGGRGIKVCKRWRIFANFVKDMGNRPSEDYCIHRKNNNLDYSPKNCEWILKMEHGKIHSNNLTKNRI
jgi:hypothetical protein